MPIMDSNPSAIPSSAPSRGRMQLVKPQQTMNSGRAAATPQRTPMGVARAEAQAPAATQRTQVAGINKYAQGLTRDMQQQRAAAAQTPEENSALQDYLEKLNSKMKLAKAAAGMTREELEETLSDMGVAASRGLRETAEIGAQSSAPSNGMDAQSRAHMAVQNILNKIGGGK